MRSQRQAFRFLQETELEHLATFLRREHPQTIAVVASHLPPDRAGELLAHLPSPIQVQVIRRLADLEQADPRVLLEVERGLQQWLAEQVQNRRRRTDGVAAVSAILDSSPPATRRDIMDNLQRHDRPLAGKFRTNQCTFAEWTHQNDAALVAVFEAADPEMRMLALAGATAEFVERLTRLIPPQQARTLKRASRIWAPPGSRILRTPNNRWPIWRRN